MQMTKTPILIPTLLAAFALTSCREAQIPLPPAEPAPQAPAAVVATPEATPPSTGEFPAMAAVCNIESVNDQSGEVLDAPVRVSAITSVSGWRTLGTGEAAMAPAWLRATGADGAVAFQAFVPGTEDRPDVAELHGNPAALRSGFRDVAVEGLQPGTYTLEVILGSGDGFIRCAHARTLVVE